MKIKICGLRRKEDILYANECLPDYVGFVFAESRRRVTREQARDLRRALADGISAVGVFVNEPEENIAELVREGIIDTVQLHGEETERGIGRLRALVPEAKIIKAVRVAAAEDICRGAQTEADFLLLDAFSEKGRGGMGKKFDWELIRNIEKPYFLAGGVSVREISRAAELPGIYAVDVSSAAETDGYKDRDKMREIVQAVRTV